MPPFVQRTSLGRIRSKHGRRWRLIPLVSVSVEGTGFQVFGERHEGRYTLKLTGAIDLSTVRQFEDAIRLAAAAVERTVVVDLSEVDHIDSTGVTALLQVETTARGDVDRIWFLNKFRPEVEAVLRMSGVYDQLRLIEPDASPTEPS